MIRSHARSAASMIALATSLGLGLGTTAHAAVTVTDNAVIVDAAAYDDSSDALDQPVATTVIGKEDKPYDPTDAPPASSDDGLTDNRRHRDQARDQPAGDADRDLRGRARQRSRTATSRACSTWPTAPSRRLRVATFEARQSALTIGIRGIVPFDANQPAREQGVGVYIDGVYLGRQQGLNAALFDVERDRSAARAARHAVRPQHRRRRAQHRHARRRPASSAAASSAGVGNFGSLQRRAPPRPAGRSPTSRSSSTA